MFNSKAVVTSESGIYVVSLISFGAVSRIFGKGIGLLDGGGEG